jgi:hypothetical protein
MRKQMILLAVMLLAATTAVAGMGNNGGGAPGRPGNGGTGVGLGPAAGPGGWDLTVAADGTVLTVTRTGGDPAVPGSGTIELVAISPTGGTLWTWTSPGAIHALEIGGSTVLVSTVEPTQAGTAGVPGSGQQANSVLHALALTSGATLWTLEVDGRILRLEPAANVIYAIVADHELVEGTEIVPRGGMRGTGEINLVAISYQGVVSWTVPLHP